MTSPHEIREFVDSTRPKDWYGQCAGLTYRTIKECEGYAPDIYGSAFAAYRATEIESRDPLAAPPGAIHYWDYYGTDDRGRVARWGHVAIDIYGGGHHVLSATGYAHEWWGKRAGLITVAAQTARGMPYLGWSRFYGARNRIEIGDARPAGKGQQQVVPAEVPAPKRRRKRMVHAAYQDDAGTIAVQARPGGRLTQLKDPLEWRGIAAASGAEYAKVTNAELQALGDRFGGFLESPVFDGAVTGQGATILAPDDARGDFYVLLGEKAFWIDQPTLNSMLARGAVQVTVPRAQIEARTA
ncbi:hypothetical protein [Microbacterium arborescens]